MGTDVSLCHTNFNAKGILQFTVSKTSLIFETHGLVLGVYQCTVP